MPNGSPPIMPPQFATRPDIRLIACDLDGTLLDDAHAIHDEFWPLIDELHRRGIIFCPASGRQYYSLLERFAPVADELIFIAENGSYVVEQGRELSSDCLSLPEARELLRTYRSLRASGAPVEVVLCGKTSAYIESASATFRTEVDRYYPRMASVADLLAVEDEILKVALYTHESSERVIYPAFSAYSDRHLVVVSGKNWLDVMASGVNKGSGIRHIQALRGISKAQTMVFGDFLNDLEMMDEADYAFAMANAHPDLKARATYLAPHNTENGVVRTIKAVLGID
ncbi:Cof-type HAD-IIB family hydrolase [Chitinilyticum piscinae]|uniref:HAD family hydrolase n=1 Tax=Chitinilyticum piscinae TaxID=2866724 RepID=A0A8J7KAT0_9NEIS|nr:Cof-type HAD-IIB family hydrolase [Chitinilyticum piscinae]MBE9609424.1 HAD family hydrolase [Chitinilyticum piscinae]